MQMQTGGAPFARFVYPDTTTRDAAVLSLTDVGSIAFISGTGAFSIVTAVSIAGVGTWATLNVSPMAELAAHQEMLRSLAYAVDNAAMGRFTAPAAADLVAVKAAADVANGAITIVANSIDYPRKLQVRVVDANSSISAGTLTLVGVDQDGQAVTETIALTGGTATTKTTYAYASLTSGTVANLAGAATGDTLGIGLGNALGLSRTARSVLKTTLNVFKANVDNANETVGTIDSTARTIEPTTAPNATHNYTFWYNFT